MAPAKKIRPGRDAVARLHRRHGYRLGLEQGQMLGALAVQRRRHHRAQAAHERGRDDSNLPLDHTAVDPPPYAVQHGGQLDARSSRSTTTSTRRRRYPHPCAHMHTWRATSTNPFAMPGAKAIEDAVKALPPQDLAEFRRWTAEFDLALSDQKIDGDLAAGKLNNLPPDQVLVQSAFDVNALYGVIATPSALRLDHDGHIDSDLAIGSDAIKQLRGVSPGPQPTAGLLSMAPAAGRC